MYHDFQPGMLDCIDSGNIMDYDESANEWSECSRKYFENDYHEKRWGDSCLLPLSGIQLINQNTLCLTTFELKLISRFYIFPFLSSALLLRGMLKWRMEM